MYKEASFVRYSTIRDGLLNADFTGEYLNKEPVKERYQKVQYFLLSLPSWNIKEKVIN